MSAAMNGGAHVAQGIRSEASDDTSVFPNRALSFNWEPAFMADLIDGSMVLPDAPSFKMGLGLMTVQWLCAMPEYGLAGGDKRLSHSDCAPALVDDRRGGLARALCAVLQYVLDELQIALELLAACSRGIEVGVK